MNKPFPVIFENEKFICEAECERNEDGTLSYYNVLVTDKSNMQSREELEMPEGILAIATAVANASLDDEDV